MVDTNWRLTEYLGKTTIDAAAAGLQLIEWVTALDQNIACTLANGRIHFQASRPFCTLYPKTDHIACRIHHHGRAHTLHLTRQEDIDHALRHSLWHAYQEAS